MFEKVAIIGLGLIGGSFAAGIKKRGLAKEVVAGVRSQRTLQEGLALGYIDGGDTDLAAVVRGADVVFVSVPVSAMETTFQAMAPGLGKECIVTDGGSVKGNVIAAARNALPNHLAHVVPGHPIAGKEKSGVSAADADLYVKHRVILTPLPETLTTATDKITKLWQALGAEVLSMPGDEHDKVLAETSHLPHLIAFSMVDTLARQGDSMEIFRYAAGGFRDFTRIASSDPTMWHDIFLENKEAVLASVDLFTEGLATFRQYIENADSAELLGSMTRANSARRHFLAMSEKTAYSSVQHHSEETSMSEQSQQQVENISFVVSPGGTIQGDIRLLGDKSISHRSIMLGALAEGVTEVEGFLEGEDALATIQAFRDMGVVIEGPQAGRVTIHGVGLHGLQAPQRSLYMGNSGTTMRLLMGLLSGQAFDTQLTGDASLTQRPMERVAKPLRTMNAVINTTDGTPPVDIHGSQKLQATTYDMPVASAQVKSAVMLAGLYADGVTEVIEPAPSRDHTERMLEGFGYPVKREGNRVSVQGGGKLTGCKLEVPVDISSAAFFMVAACIAPGSDLYLRHVGMNPTRTGVVEILRLMGADITVENERDSGGEPVADLRIRYTQLKGITIPEELVPLAIDEFPVLFVAAACAEGETVLTGASELRVKESDRIQVMADGLSSFGVEVETYPDGLRIVGQPEFTGGTVESHHDHRIAMSFAMAGLRATSPIHIHGCETVATSFPGFAELAAHVGLGIKKETA